MPEVPSHKLREPPAPPAVVEKAECDYAELDVTSNFSFLRGASHPDELVFRATELGYRAIAITDLNSLAGVVRAHDATRQVKEQGGVPPQLIIGSRLSFSDAPDLLVWATDRAAYGRLCRLLTAGKRRAEKGQCALSIGDFLEHSEGLLAAIDPGPNRIANEDPPPLPYCMLRDALGPRLSLATSCLYGEDDKTRLENLVAFSRRVGIPLLATNNVHYHIPDRRMLQDVLTCVRHGCTIHEAGFKLFPNGERYLKSPAQMHRLFSEYPQAIRRGIEIAQQCHFSLDELRYEYPDELVPAGKRTIEFLAELAWAGAARRYGGLNIDDSEVDIELCKSHTPQKVRQLIEHELVLIEKLKYEAYFLTVYDLVKFARSRGILCQGRGSAANSAVCYCIGVTSVDPSRIDLLFERFVSAARNEPPDIDVDFEHERREEVIQYIYEKYGRERAGMTAEVITYRGRSAVRDVGKALGLSLDLVDQMARKLDWWDRGTLQDAQLRELGLDPSDRTVRLVVDIVAQVLGFPRHLSQHVGGMVMTRGALCELVPIENAAMADRTVIEWDKDDIDALGILKVDVLALGMLTCISKAFRYINSDEATKRRSDEGEERSNGAAKRRSDKGNEKKGGEYDGRREAGDNTDTDVSRPDCLAKGEGVDEADLSRDAADAAGRAVRADKPNATVCGFDSFEHRGGTCKAEPRGISEIPENCARLTGRIDNSGGDCLGVGVDPAPSEPGRFISRGRPDPAGIDPESGEEGPLKRSSSLRRSVACGCAASSLRRLELHTIPPEDPIVYDMISDADTVGVFQVESRAQMSMLPRLRPRCFYDLVIEVAIVRPGPIQGNMVHPYLKRRNGEEPVSYPSEALRQVLEKTLGVPLFQEQAMRVAMVGAGFSADEADKLRRAMAAWRKHGAIDAFHQKIVEGMLRNGYTREFAEQCFLQIRGFGEYGFPESHAASFALLVYVSAWLKRYYPAEFCAALLNSQPMGFYAPAQIVRDAKEHGVEVRPVDVNYSGWDCTLEKRRSDEATERRREGEEQRRSDEATKRRREFRIQNSELRTSSVSSVNSVAKSEWGKGGPAVRLGMRQVKGLRQDHAERLVRARERVGRFDSIAQIHRATGLPRRTLQRLAEADAFSSLGLSRRQALWQVLALADEEAPLFDSAPSSLRGFVASSLPQMPLGQEVMTDYRTAGLSLKRHPVGLVRPILQEKGIITAEELRRLTHGKWVRVAGLVLIRQRPGTASGIVFETLEDETGIVNLIVRPNIYDKYRSAARHAGLLQAEGYVERQGDVIHVMVWRMVDLSDLLAGHQFTSRDFH